MSTIPGTFRNGHIDLDVPVDWPEGARVTVIPSDGRVGLTEEAWPDDEAGRAQLAELIASFEPVEMTPADEREWEAARAAVKDYTIKQLAADAGTIP